MADGFTSSGPAAETPKDFGDDPSGVVTRWVAWLKLTERNVQKFEKRGRAIVRRYRDDRDNEADTKVRYNVLWSNVQTMAPARYIRPPRVQVERRYRDPDPIGRLGAQILERATGYEVERNDAHEVFKACNMDVLLPGRGTARVFYECEKDEAGNVVEEFARLGYVFWEDYRDSVARQWPEVDAVGYRSFLTRDELKARFPDCAEMVPLDADIRDKDKVGAIADVFKKATIWEIWNKSANEVVWISPGYADRPLDRLSPPPLKLEGFFPSPRPVTATTTNDTTVPIPDFYEYQGQADELDMITQRIGILLRALRMKGFYAGDAHSELAQLFGEQSGENEMVPVHDWAAWMEKGGVEKMITWFPIEQLAKVLAGLFEARERVKADLNEITGISDIIRGVGDPGATATAERIKGQFATLRLQIGQQEMQRFVRDCLRLMAEVIAEQFSPEMLSKMTGLPELPPQPQIQPPQPPGDNAVNDPAQMQAFMQAQQQYAQVMGEWQAATEKAKADFAQACALLKNDRMRGFRLDIETDSTIAPDEQAEKEARVEFLTAIGVFFEKVAPLVQAGLIPAPVAKEMLMFLARGFKAGRDLEQALENLDKIAPPQAAGPDPIEAEKVKLERERMQMEGADKAAGRALEKQKLDDDRVATERRDALEGHKLSLENRKIDVTEQSEAGRLLMDGQKVKQADRHKDIDRETAAQEVAGATPEAAQKIEKMMEAIIELAKGIDEMQEPYEAEEMAGPDGRLAGVRKRFKSGRVVETPYRRAQRQAAE